MYRWRRELEIFNQNLLKVNEKFEHKYKYNDLAYYDLKFMFNIYIYGNLISIILFMLSWLK